jgi:hypothetical protein
MTAQGGILTDVSFYAYWRGRALRFNHCSSTGKCNAFGTVIECREANSG